MSPKSKCDRERTMLIKDWEETEKSGIKRMNMSVIYVNACTLTKMPKRIIIISHMIKEGKMRKKKSSRSEKFCLRASERQQGMPEISNKELTPRNRLQRTTHLQNYGG
jgi:hypothetical protein